MTVYVALLKGVNVGGRSKVDMRELKAQFEKLGCRDVRTYINSGNVVFGDRRSASTLTRLLEEALGRRVAVRTLAQMEALCERLPEEWGNDKEQKTDVGFLLDEPGEKLWHALRKDLAPRYVVDWDGADVTARNVNTVRKLLDLMRSR
ncbi:MAG TPA: DUF1697 domain-containing protein [Gaiellaceae bacterium]|nr:DUF1697 domain-containing protein [Gaiellaceae bacterium]